MQGKRAPSRTVSLILYGIRTWKRMRQRDTLCYAPFPSPFPLSYPRTRNSFPLSIKCGLSPPSSPSSFASVPPSLCQNICSALFDFKEELKFERASPHTQFTPKRKTRRGGCIIILYSYRIQRQKRSRWTSIQLRILQQRDHSVLPK